MITRAINLMGAYVGEPEDLVPAAPDNSAGFWEREDVVGLSTRIFRECGAEWYAPLDFDLARLGDASRAECRKEIRAAIARLDARQPWVLKDPRMCFMLPLWRPELSRPVFVFAQRHPIEVAQSLADRDFFSLDFGLALWEAYTLAALSGSRGAPRVIVSYNDCLGAPDATLRKLHDDLVAAGVTGLQGPGPETQGFVQPRLRHQKAAGAVESIMAPVQRRLLQALESGEAFKDAFRAELSPEARAAMLAHRERVKRVQGRLQKLLGQIKTRDRLLGDLVLTGRLLTSSGTWRVGNLLTGWYRRWAMRRRPGAEWPEKHVENLAREIEDLWRQEGRLD